MSKYTLVFIIILLVKTVVFSQDLVSCEIQSSDYAYFVNNKEALNIEDSADVYPKITFRLRKATLKMILDSFVKKYPDYPRRFSDISTCPDVKDFEIENATLEEFLNKLLKLFPIYGRVNGRMITIGVKASSQKTISNVAKKSTKKPVLNKNTQARTTTANKDTSKNEKITMDNVQSADTMVFDSSIYVFKNPKAYDLSLKDTLNAWAKPLDTVYKNGLQIINAGKATGAYYKPYKKLLQEAYTDANIIDRVFNISIPLPKNGNYLQGTMPGSLRGAVSLHGNRSAHIVLDNFGYHSHTDFVNPMDVSDVTFIKDAAGGAIWGVNSSNGIMALTTKTGDSSGLEINVINSFEVGQKPDLDYLAGPNAGERIDLEKQAWLQYGNSLVRTRVTDVLTRVKERTLTQFEGDSILASWRSNNFSKEVKDAFYQVPQRQVHGISVSTGKQKFRLYASLGRDNSRMAEKGNTWNRTTFMTNVSWFSKKLEFTLNPSVATIRQTNNFITLPLDFSYLSLYDRNGNSSSIPWVYPTDLTTNAVQRGFLNWQFVPIDEARYANNRIVQNYYQLNGRIRYNIIKNLYASAFAQYGYSGYIHRNLHVLQSFFTRDLVNLYRQRDASGRFYWPIPSGDILDEENAVTLFQNHRAQIDYKGGWKDCSIMATGGFERREQHTGKTTSRIYGNDIGLLQSQIDYTRLFDISIYPGERRTIPYRNTRTDSINNFFSYYASAYITWRNRYTISGNYRTDYTNRFSVATNEKTGIGLWSIGGAWNAGEEPFMRRKHLNGLRFRVSYGVNGNVDYDARPGRVIQPSAPGSASTVAIPGSPLLRWEKLHIFNAGVDLLNTGKWLYGNIDYYNKRGTDLMHMGAWNPTTGVSVVRNNSGSLIGEGIDVWLRTKRFTINRSFTYNSDLILAYTINKVTSPESFSKPAQQYIDTYIPVAGYPVEALFAFQFAGFNPANGAPIGYLRGEQSEKYAEILASPADSVMSYVGSAVPVTVAGFIQSLNYKAFTLSVQLTGKFGYYTRVRAVDRLNLFDINRQTFYQYSTANVIRADNIRLQQVRLAYEVSKKYHPRLPFKKLGVNVSVNNVGILYRLHKQVDPDIPVDGYPAGRHFAFTLTVTY